MSRPLPERLLKGLRHALLTALAGFGLSVLVMAALFGQVSWAPLAAAVAGTAMVLCMLRAVSGRLTAVVILIGGILLGLGCLNLGPLAGPAQSLRVFWVYSDLLSTALAPYRAVLGILLPVLLTAVCAAAVLIDLPTLTLLPMALTSIVLGTQLIGNTGLSALIGTGTCAAAYLLALAQEKSRLLGRPLIIAGAAFALVLLFAPRTLPTAPKLREKAEDVYQTVYEYLPVSDESARAGFTLETEGYLPLGSEGRPRLGGPADPSEHPVMEVSTSHTLYLRGVAMNSYTGLNWEDTLSNRRYLYADLLQQTYRRNIFDEYLPVTSDSPALETASVHMLTDASTTLFVPQRLRSLETRSAHMTPYFNTGSELFLTRELEAGDGYAFTYLRLPADSGETARLVEEAAAVADKRYNEIAQAYTTVSPQVRQTLSSLSTEAAAGEEAPYFRALRIRDYLRSHYPYNLNTSVPPENTDFVTWFLLRERRGYCTYFATALTILCRIQGIPARYVTGYVAVPENGLATVTSADAHAWTEIYLNGFGWLTLDATPGDRDEDEDRNSSGTKTPEDDRSTPTPEPQTSPEPSDSPEPDGPEPGTATPTPEPQPEQTEQPNSEPPVGGISWPLLMIFLAVTIIGLCLLMYILYDPARRAARNPRRASEILLAAVDAAFRQLFRPRRPDETLIEYYTAAAERYPDLPLAELADAYSAQVYGKRTVPASLPLAVWKQVEDRLSFPQRVGVLAAAAASRPSRAAKKRRR